MQENASTIGTGSSIGMWSSAQDQWLSESCRIVVDTTFQARPGKKFQQKLDILGDTQGLFLFAHLLWGTFLVPHKYVMLKI